MEEEKFAIVNEAGLTVHGRIFRPKPKGSFPLIVIAGDFFNTANDATTKELAKQFLEKNIAVVRFDFTNSFGESDGRAEDITISQRARDLGLVTEYAKRRAYINDKRVAILGYGFGAMATVVLEGFQALTRALVLVNAAKSVEDTAWTSFPDRDMMRIRLKRYFHIQHEGQDVRINYTFYEDGARIDMPRCVRNLKTPVLYIAGTQSTVIPAEHTNWLYERTNGKKELLLVPDGRDLETRKSVSFIVQKTISFLQKQKVL